MKIKGFKLWEIALAFGVVCAISFGCWAQAAQEELSGKLVRLHVVANSDSAYDQELKLKVRDRILEAAQPLLAGISAADEASAILEKNLPYLTEQARLELDAANCRMDVRAKLAYEDFPTREYESFKLPAGRYQALRVTIGEGGGHNWWCVVFPPLCSAGENIGGNAKAAGLTDGDVALITEGDGVKIKFWCVEIWQKIRKML